MSSEHNAKTQIITTNNLHQSTILRVVQTNASCTCTTIARVDQTDYRQMSRFLVNILIAGKHFWPTVVEPMSRHVICLSVVVVVYDVLYCGETAHPS